MNTLLSFDSWLFLAINNLPHPYIANVIAILLSAGSGYIWYFLFALALLLVEKKKGNLRAGGNHTFFCFYISHRQYHIKTIF